MMNTLNIAVDEAARTGVDDGETRGAGRVQTNGVAVPAGGQGRGDYLEELREVLSRIGRLRGLLSVCTYCNRIGAGRDRWHDLREPQASYCDVGLGQTICPDCYVSIIRPEAEMLYAYFNESGRTAPDGARRVRYDIDQVQKDTWVRGGATSLRREPGDDPQT